MTNNDIPFEVGYEQAKAEMREAIGKIGRKYGIPPSLLTIALTDLAANAQLNAYKNILLSLDLVSDETSDSSTDSAAGSTTE